MACYGSERATAGAAAVKKVLAVQEISGRFEDVHFRNGVCPIPVLCVQLLGHDGVSAGKVRCRS